MVQMAARVKNQGSKIIFLSSGISTIILLNLAIFDNYRQIYRYAPSAIERNRTLKLSTYFVLSFALIIVIVITSVSIVYGQRTKSALEREIGESLTSLSYGMGDKLDRYMWSRYNEIMLLGTLDVFRKPADLQEAKRLLSELQENIPAFSWVGLLDVEGNVKAATGNILEGENIAQRPVYAEALHGPFCRGRARCRAALQAIA